MKLELGEEISAGITVRGSSVTEQNATALASPVLDTWQAQQAARLPDGCHYEPSTEFSQKPQGEYRLKRILKVVEDEDSQ